MPRTEPTPEQYRDLCEAAARVHQTAPWEGQTEEDVEAWPLFRAYDSGVVERPLNQTEAELLLHAFAQVLQVAPRVRQDPGLLVDRRRGALLVRVGQEGGWLDRYEVPEQPALPWECGQADPFTLSRLRQLERTRRTMELAFFHIWSPIGGESDLPPFYPYLLLAVDAGSGMVLGFETLTPAPSFTAMWQQLPSHLARLFETAGGLPAVMRVDDRRLQAALQPLLHSLKVRLVKAPLRRLPKARAVLEQELETPAVIPPSPPADDEPPLLPAWADPTLPLDLLAAYYQHIQMPKVPAKELAGIEKALRAQPFDADQPGAVHLDLETMLRVIGNQPLELTPAEGVPRGRFMAAVNGMLVNPFPAASRQPAPRSFPNVRGLYHLLWSTGLGQATPDQRYLRLDPAAVAEWRALNPTERYFSLLEAWLLGPDPDGDPPVADDELVPLERCLDLANELAIGPYNPEASAADYEVLRLETGLTNLALAALFGLVVRTAATVRPAGRPVLAQAFGLIESAPWGQGLLARLEHYLIQERGTKDSARARREDGLMPAVKGLFPAWKQRLTRPYWQEWQSGLAAAPERAEHQEAEPALSLRVPDQRSRQAGDPPDSPRAGSAPQVLHPQVLVKVALGKSWRRLAVPEDTLLHELAQAIVEAFGFAFDHLYAFHRGTRPGEGPAINHPGLEEGQRADQTRLADLGLHPGDRLVLRFDFGDEWLFRLEVEEARFGEEDQVAVVERQGRPPAQYPR